MDRNRHFAEWRFLRFTLVVTARQKTWNVNVRHQGPTSFRRVWLTARRFMRRLLAAYHGVQQKASPPHPGGLLKGRTLWK